MWFRLLLIVIVLVAAVLASVWVAERPGTVDFTWLGYTGQNMDIRVVVGILVLLVLIYTAAVFLLRWLITRPRDLRQSWQSWRRRRGYRALTQGMVAVAAGDPDEARKWAKRANDLLDDPPLTLLLAAQSAQLDGDEQAARRYFEVMLEQPETRFLGLRGLVQIMLRRGDEETALDYVREAYSLRPETPWVLEALFDLAERRGRLEDAVRALDEARRRKALPRTEVDRKRAVLLYEEAKAAREARRNAEAAERARQALKLEPGLVPAVVLMSDALVALDRQRDAVRALRRAWSIEPHPDLYAAWKRTRPAGEASDARRKSLMRLVSDQPEHLETRLALADAALEAGNWAEVRNELQAAEERSADTRIAELLARLEQAEHGDAAAARSWLETAAGRPAAPSWTCRVCVHEAETWSPRCPACHSFDSLAWRTGRPLPHSGVALSPSAEDSTQNSPFSPIIAAEAEVTPAAGSTGKAATPPEKQTVPPEEAARRGG